MKKLLQLIDNNILRFGVCFTILFTVLYPKLPSINIDNTWVYIRLEDFVILALSILWFIQLIRKKVSLPRPEGYAVILYWIAGLASLLYVLSFVAPHLSNFFPKIAWLQYFRRIEYMILFFIAFSSIKNIKDVYMQIVTVCVAVAGVVIYGFGQRFYFLLWAAFPDFFKQNPFCFPAFLTGNEEFAKGTPICLNELSRVSSTFGGHYDLSAYMVMVIPILVALAFAVKKWHWKILLVVLAILSLEILNFTSSRTSFGAYVIGITSMLIFWQKKRWILPVLAVSLVVMLMFGNATIQRFAHTIQAVQVVSVQEELPDDLKKMIADAKKAEELKNAEVPPASDFTVGSEKDDAGFSTVLTDEQLRNLSISSVSGSFLIKKAYALDISFTTRFQAEWPRNWNAFLYSPVFGTGYSSLTLATDNDYLRALGETGLAGTLTFLLIFVVFGIFVRRVLPEVKDPIVTALLYGLVGGVIGLLINAVLIDVFEASKVAEPLWLLLGLGVAAAKLYQKKQIDYKKELASFFTHPVLVVIYLILLILLAYGASMKNFFVADDFTWLRWAATAAPSDLGMYFVHSPDFFYRPFDKVVVYCLYMLGSFQPELYRVFMIFVHFLTTMGVLSLATKLTQKRLLGFLIAAVFAILPAHTENLFWFSTLSIHMSALFIVWAMLLFIRFREKNSVFAYIASILLSALAFVTYEISVVIPLIMFTIDLFITKPKRSWKTVSAYLPFIILVVLYFVMRSVSGAFSGGGDYSYNLSKVVPNVLGNFFGYIGLYLGGLAFMPLYDQLRGSLREVALVMSGLAVVIGGLGFTFYKSRKRIVKLFRNSEIQLILFGIVFAFVALLPFLPLGNMAPRYLYLASIGFSIAFVVGADVLLRQFIKSGRIITISLFAIFLIIGGSYLIQNKGEYIKWHTAGLITQQSLLVFRANYGGLTPNDNVYIVDMPVKNNGVWVFPVGFSDGLWFIYREKTPQVIQAKSIEEARFAKQQNPRHTYIFQFKNGTIFEVK